MTELLPSCGTLTLICKDLFQPQADGPKHDLTIRIRRLDRIWDREATATATMSNPLHELVVEQWPADGAGLSGPWRLRGRIAPDPWVVYGGMITLVFSLDAAGRGQGSYEFQGQTQTFEIDGTYAALPRPSRGRRADGLEILEAFAEHGPAGRLADFSYAGYRHGVSQPADDCQDLPVFSVCDFGAEPDSGQCCHAAVQKAIDAASERGGIVEFPAGTFDVRVDAPKEPWLVQASRVVLRGAGSGPHGTVIVNHRASRSPEYKKPWLAGEGCVLKFVGQGLDDHAPTWTVLNCKRGAMHIDLDDASQVQFGMTVLLQHCENEELSLGEELLLHRGPRGANWKVPGRALVTQLLTVTAVDGNRVSVDAPLHWHSDSRWQSALRPVSLLHEVGVEAIRFRSHWQGYFVHHKSPEHDNGWDHVGGYWLADSWMHDMIHENATTAVGLSNCKNCSIVDQRMEGNPGHNGICCGGMATGNLMLRCDTERAMHSFNIAGTGCGNAVVDCQISEPGGIDFHGSMALDTLIDNLRGGVFKGGGSPANIPPRHSLGLTLWNWSMGVFDPYQAWRPSVHCAQHDTAPGFTAVGVHGRCGQEVGYRGPDGLCTDNCRYDWAWVESMNQAVTPLSLYQYQCQQRLGVAPS